MQILGNEKAFKDKNPDKFIYYEAEREKHLSNLPKNIEYLNNAKSRLFKTSEPKDFITPLMSPKDRREEIF